MWKYDGQTRPPFAEQPGRGQESVWDYPRPPRLVEDSRIVTVQVGERLVAETREAVRVLETASPPTFYLPPDDVDRSCLRKADTSGTYCEWKGRASYWDVVIADQTIARCAWSYPEPLPAFQPLGGFFSFYPGRIACFVTGERVQPQPGSYYGGWMTSEIVGPVKGGPGSGGW